MKLAVTAEGATMDAAASSLFGRCPSYLFIDTATLDFEAADNPAIGAPGGAGVQAAQFVVEQGAQAVVTGDVGPNALEVFQAADVPVYRHAGGSVRAVVEALLAGDLQTVTGPSVAAGVGKGEH